MILSGRNVHFTLSATGQAEFGELARPGKAVEAFVVSEDHLGAWIWMGERVQPSGLPKVTLLKWDHFSTAWVEYEPKGEADEPRRPAGFRP